MDLWWGAFCCADLGMVSVGVGLPAPMIWVRRDETVGGDTC